MLKKNVLAVPKNKRGDCKKKTIYFICSSIGTDGKANC